MNKKEKLQGKIAKLQTELHEIEVKEWWAARPHILEFECEYDYQYSDDGDFDDYFNPSSIVLNYEWIKYNGIEWQTFCDHNSIDLYPDAEDLSDNCESYLYSITNPNDYEYEYPEFVKYSGLTIRNPNYA
jgi:hypothetical protein